MPALTVRYRISDDRRPLGTLRANERARIRITARALETADMSPSGRRAAWALTFHDLGKWHLKHGTRYDGRRRFVSSLRASPLRLDVLGWLALALLPDAAHSGARKLARGLRSKRGVS
jgi:hypothetical protein